MKPLQVSDPFVRIHSFLFSCSRRDWFSSDSPAILVTKFSGIWNANMGLKSVGNALRSLTSTTSVAMSSTKRFCATFVMVSRWSIEHSSYASRRTYLVIGKHAIQCFLRSKVCHIWDCIPKTIKKPLEIDGVYLVVY